MGEAPRANADVRLKFEDKETSGLGIPLPGACRRDARAIGRLGAACRPRLEVAAWLKAGLIEGNYGI